MFPITSCAHNRPFGRRINHGDVIADCCKEVGHSWRKVPMANLERCISQLITAFSFLAVMT